MRYLIHSLQFKCFLYLTNLEELPRHFSPVRRFCFYLRDIFWKTAIAGYILQTRLSNRKKPLDIL